MKKIIIGVLIGSMMILQACAGSEDGKEDIEGIGTLKAYVEGIEWPCFIDTDELSEFIVKTDVPSYLYGIEFSTTYDKYYVDPNNKAGTYPWNAVLPPTEWLQVCQTDSQTYVCTIIDHDQVVPIILMFADKNGNKGPDAVYINVD